MTAPYTAKPGGERRFPAVTLPYSEKWPDPASMDVLPSMTMDEGAVVVQIPCAQIHRLCLGAKDNDEAYMIEQGYAVGDGEGGQYRIPILRVVRQ